MTSIRRFRETGIYVSYILPRSNPHGQILAVKLECWGNCTPNDYVNGGTMIHLAPQFMATRNSQTSPSCHHSHRGVSTKLAVVHLTNLTMRSPQNWGLTWILRARKNTTTHSGESARRSSEFVRTTQKSTWVSTSNFKSSPGNFSWQGVKSCEIPRPGMGI